MASTCGLHQEEDGRNLIVCRLPQGKHEDIKNAYPLPLIDKVQDCLSGATIFSKLDYQCGFWQVPVDQEKTAFSPGPGLGLFQFTRMPFGLCGAPSTFQRLMDVVMQGLPFVKARNGSKLVPAKDEAEVRRFRGHDHFILPQAHQ